MKPRTMCLSSGAVMEVPPYVYRVETPQACGWQMRYGVPSLYFADARTDTGLPGDSLALARQALLDRIRRIPPTGRVQSAPSISKKSNLPVGISGPIVRRRKGCGVEEVILSVNLRTFKGKSRTVSIYLGTRNTYTPERFERALQRAVDLRAKHEAEYVARAAAALNQMADALSDGTAVASAAGPDPLRDRLGDPLLSPLAMVAFDRDPMGTHPLRSDLLATDALDCRPLAHVPLAGEPAAAGRGAPGL